MSVIEACIVEIPIPLEKSCMNISDLVKAVEDAGRLSYEDPETTQRVRGRDIFGQDAVPALLDVIFLIK
jgi:hypothetical protein